MVMGHSAKVWIIYMALASPWVEQFHHWRRGDISCLMEFSDASSELTALKSGGNRLGAYYRKWPWWRWSPSALPENVIVLCERLGDNLHTYYTIFFIFFSNNLCQCFGNLFRIPRLKHIVHDWRRWNFNIVFLCSTTAHKSDRTIEALHLKIGTNWTKSIRLHGTIGISIMSDSRRNSLGITWDRAIFEPRHRGVSNILCKRVHSAFATVGIMICNEKF